MKRRCYLWLTDIICHCHIHDPTKAISYQEIFEKISPKRENMLAKDGITPPKPYKTTDIIPVLRPLKNNV